MWSAVTEVYAYVEALQTRRRAETSDSLLTSLLAAEERVTGCHMASASTSCSTSSPAPSTPPRHNSGTRCGCSPRTRRQVGVAAAALAAVTSGGSAVRYAGR